MKRSAMKRIRSLKPFSRDHGVGLVCAQQARKAVCASKADQLELVKQIRATCRDSILTFMEDEQWVLSPLIGDDQLRATFHEKQKNIRQLADELETIDESRHRGLGVLSMLADALDDYVRWEEHMLFPRIEESIESEQLQQLSKLTATIEAKRSRPTQKLHSSVNAMSFDRTARSIAHALIVIGTFAFVLKLITSALSIFSAEWLRNRIRPGT